MSTSKQLSFIAIGLTVKYLSYDIFKVRLLLLNKKASEYEKAHTIQTADMGPCCPALPNLSSHIFYRQSLSACVVKKIETSNFFRFLILKN